MAPPDFSNSTRELLAKRANQICSNPECGAATAAASQSSPDKVIVVGEAAHIYGARETTARYRASMSDIERADIINGIWLCRNCHKAIDDDQNSYPADLLYKWQSIHEVLVFERLGKRNSLLRRELFDEEIESLGKIPEIAKRIIRDTPDAWEFKLTAVLLPHHLKSAEQRWDELTRGFYTKKLSHVEPKQFIGWMTARNMEILQTIRTLTSLVEELQTSWGKPGEAGEATKINRACLLLGRMAGRMVDWEEDVKFMLAHEPFDQIPDLLAGAGGHNIKELGTIKQTLDRIIEFNDDDSRKESRTFEHTLIIDLPNNWEANLSAGLKKAERKYFQMIEDGEVFE